MGYIDKAIEQFKKALVFKPNHAKTYFDLSIVRPEKEQVPIIENYLSKNNVSKDDAMYYHYAIGYICNSFQQYSKAFEHFSEANRAVRETVNYNSKHHSGYVDSLINIFSYDFFKERKVLVQTQMFLFLLLVCHVRVHR